MYEQLLKKWVWHENLCDQAHSKVVVTSSDG